MMTQLETLKQDLDEAGGDVYDVAYALAKRLGFNHEQPDVCNEIATEVSDRFLAAVKRRLSTAE